MNLDQALDAADRLAHPGTPGLLAESVPAEKPWWPQSLAHGALGIAVLHAELAAAGLRPWRRVHDWLAMATRGPVTTGASAGLFYGAPALAFALTCTTAALGAVHPDAYRGALQALDAAITEDAGRRVQAARARIAAGDLPALAEFDTLRGLAGIGAYLLRRDRGGDALRAILEYLVDLTTPIHDGGRQVPGWWTRTGPTGRPDPDFPGGHSNNGLAHGVGGPLALLALATLRGVTVPRQAEAIGAICAWLDSWRTHTDTGSGAESGMVWPYLIRRAQLDGLDRRDGLDRPDTGIHTSMPARRARRPSWCYGTAGLARVQQLAALATGNAERRRIAEAALVHALTDPAQRAVTTDASLCHGYAGLAHIAGRAAADATETAAARLRMLVPELLDSAQPHQPHQTDQPVDTGTVGLLEGVAGVALATLAASTGLPPATGWDACLLIA